MEFEWDGEKSEACAKARRFNFDYAAFAFFDPNRIVKPDTRYNYGEERFELMGLIDGRLYVVVYTHCAAHWSASFRRAKQIKSTRDQTL